MLVVKIHELVANQRVGKIDAALVPKLKEQQHPLTPRVSRDFLRLLKDCAGKLSVLLASLPSQGSFLSCLVLSFLK